jgi:ribosomal RNA-processing protein 9
VLALAVSSDGRLLACGGSDRLVRVWDTRSGRLHETLRGHAAAITALAFRRGTATLFSASADRSVRVWAADAGAAQDVLFGHALPVLALAAGRAERAVSVGADRTARLWKVAEGSQLVYHAREADAALEAVALVSDSWWLTGAQTGALALWNAGRKKPVLHVDGAHGLPPPGAATASPGAAGWVGAVAVARGTDLAASGGTDGRVRLWRVAAGAEERALEPLASVSVPGCVNALAFSRSARLLVAAVGPEPRGGRWWTWPGVAAGLVFVHLPVEGVRAPGEVGAPAPAGAGEAGAANDDGGEEDEDEEGV